MKILSVIQPWAWALVTPGSGKTEEYRSWHTRYRGPLLIHAGKSRSMIGDRGEFPACPAVENLAFGAVGGLVDLVDCKDGGWVVVNPRPLAQPIPLKGRLGLWQAEPDLIEAVRAQLGDAALVVAPPIPKSTAPIPARQTADHYQTGRGLLADVKQAANGNTKKSAAVVARVATLVTLPTWAIKKILVGMGSDPRAVA